MTQARDNIGRNNLRSHQAAEAIHRRRVARAARKRGAGHRRGRAGHARGAAVVSPEDPGFSSTGGGEHALANRIGRFGAWLADMLFFLFGRPAYLFPIMLGVACFVMFRQRDDEEGPHAREHRGAHRRLHAHAVRELRARHAALERRAAAPERRRRLRPVHRQRPRGESQFPRRHACSCSPPGWPACRWPSECPGSPSSIGSAPGSGTASAGSGRAAASRAMSRWASRPRRRASKRPRLKCNARPRASSRASKRPPPVVEKSERVEKERQVPMFDAPKSGELPPLKLLDDPPAREARLFAGSARGDVAPGRTQAQGFRRRSGSRRRAAGTRGHALRNASGARREGEPDHRPREGPGAFAVRDQRARRGSDSRQIGHGSRDPEREARNRHARRDHQVEVVRRRRIAAGAGAGQGHRRRAR